MIKRIFRILLDCILGFFCMLAFGQMYSWFGIGAVAALIVYTLVLIAVAVCAVRCRKAGNAAAAGKLRLLFTLLLLLPTVLALGILILAFSAMAIYG